MTIKLFSYSFILMILIASPSSNSATEEEFNYVNGYATGTSFAHYDVVIEQRHLGITGGKLIELGKLAQSACLTIAEEHGKNKNEVVPYLNGCGFGYFNEYLVLRGKNMVPVHACDLAEEDKISCSEDKTKGMWYASGDTPHHRAYNTGYHEGEWMVEKDVQNNPGLLLTNIQGIFLTAGHARLSCKKELLNNGSPKELAGSTGAGCYDGYIDGWLNLKGAQTNSICDLKIDEIICVKRSKFKEMLDYYIGSKYDD